MWQFASALSSAVLFLHIWKDKLQLAGTQDGLHPAVHVQLAVDLRDIPLDRRELYEQVLGDLLVGVSGDDQRQDLLLAPGWRSPAGSL